MVERGPLFMSSTSFQNRMFSRLYSVRRKSSNSRNPCSSFTRLKKLMAHLLTRNSVGIFTLWQKLNVLWYLKCQQILNYITQQNMIFFKNLMRGRDKLHVTYLYERERERELILFSCSFKVLLTKKRTPSKYKTSGDISKSHIIFWLFLQGFVRIPKLYVIRDPGIGWKRCILIQKRIILLILFIPSQITKKEEKQSQKHVYNMDCVKMNLKQGEIFETSNWKKILAIFHTVFLWIVKGI